MSIDVESRARDRPGRQPDREAVRQGRDHEARRGRADPGRATVCRPARSGSTSRSASAACRAGAWSRSTARSRRARPRWRSSSSPRRRSRAASAPSSTPSTRSTSATPASSACKTEDLLISQPDHGEQALEIADTLVRSRRHRRARHRLGGGARAARRDRGRHGRSADGPAGAPHVAGAAQAHRRPSPSRRPSSSSSTRSA